jgi:pectate lyase
LLGVVRNLEMIGYNCKDGQAVAAKDCSVGPDTVTVSGTHHVWFDHDDISDGNMDINQGADYITISWTKFYYSGPRVDLAGAGAGHQFSDLIGSSDGSGAHQRPARTGDAAVRVHGGGSMRVNVNVT